MIEYEKYYQKGGNYLIPTEIFNELLEENQELKTEKEQLNSLVNSCQEEIRRLKKQLHEASIKMQEMIEQDIECPSNCSKLKELKKKLEELEEENFNLRENIYIEKMSFSSEGRNIKELIEMPTYEDLLNQQKEFIDYLEDLIKQNETVVEVSKYGLPKNCSKLLIDFYKEILSKYKEIIGGKDE